MLVISSLSLLVLVLLLIVFYDFVRCYKGSLNEKPLPMVSMPKREPKETKEYKEMKTVMSNLENYDGTGKNQVRL